MGTGKWHRLCEKLPYALSALTGADWTAACASCNSSAMHLDAVDRKCNARDSLLTGQLLGPALDLQSMMGTLVSPRGRVSCQPYCLAG